jgi:uncharacterized protein involved in type VI secretion and phage assembly
MERGEPAPPLARHWGPHRGTVVSNEDPKGRGRLQMKVPEVLGDVVSGWAAPCAAFAGPQAGFFAVPEVGAGVWVAFEAGDPSRPVWLGGWWGDDQAPEKAKPAQKVLRTPSGHTVKLDDEGKAITITDCNSQTVRLDEKGIHLADCNQQTITLDAKGIHVKATHGQTVEMDASGIEAKDKRGQRATFSDTGIEVVAGGTRAVLLKDSMTLVAGSHQVALGPGGIQLSSGGQTVDVGPGRVSINGGALVVL